MARRGALPGGSGAGEEVSWRGSSHLPVPPPFSLSPCREPGQPAYMQDTCFPLQGGVRVSMGWAKLGVGRAGGQPASMGGGGQETTKAAKSRVGTEGTQPKRAAGRGVGEAIKTKSKK